MTCPNHNGPLCTTCRLGGLIRCPVLGVPLPLVEKERAEVTKRTSRLYPDGPAITDSEALRIWKYLNERRTD